MNLLLTRLELHYLDDSLTLHVGEDAFSTLRQTIPSAINEADFDLLFEISRALVKIYDEKIESTDINVDENQLWLLRETVNSNLQFPKTPDAGIKLKLKIHKAIQESCLNNLLQEAFGESSIIINDSDLSEKHDAPSNSNSSPSQSDNKTISNSKSRKTIQP